MIETNVSKNSLWKTARFGDKKEIKKWILEFQFDCGDLIENNKFIGLESVQKIIENVGDKKIYWKIQLLEFRILFIDFFPESFSRRFFCIFMASFILRTF